MNITQKRYLETKVLFDIMAKKYHQAVRDFESGLEENALADTDDNTYLAGYVRIDREFGYTRGLEALKKAEDNLIAWFDDTMRKREGLDYSRTLAETVRKAAHMIVLRDKVLTLAVQLSA